MTSASVNYTKTHFEFKEPTRILGWPTYDTLEELHNQLKANAKTVFSNLGGGTFGYLGLVLSPGQYAMLTNVPFDRPNHPGQLVIPANATQHMARTMTEHHKEELRVFKEVTGVDATLKQFIVSAVEAPYLHALRNRQTNSIDDTVW